MTLKREIIHLHDPDVPLNPHTMQEVAGTFKDINRWMANNGGIENPIQKTSVWGFTVT